ncbi:splicing factor, arginine/serine-rich 19-like [Micropterus salmoides]|uniref:splicing factor, arginine/serine-rich 19-like n=1 Tax=Micropterus salmoides TaxID=27706 RepID=UPI0018EE110E|nr:splicing factor, arginine/serine-rich 19-like [Micropterus salmoides]
MQLGEKRELGVHAQPSDAQREQAAAGERELEGQEAVWQRGAREKKRRRKKRKRGRRGRARRVRLAAAAARPTPAGSTTALRFPLSPPPSPPPHAPPPLPPLSSVPPHRRLHRRRQLPRSPPAIATTLTTEKNPAGRGSTRAATWTAMTKTPPGGPAAATPGREEGAGGQGEEEEEGEGRRARRERQRRDAHREGGGDSSSKRCREDRSPSVEIIYEGTFISNETQSPARKRRRKRHRKAQQSSSPVIITLDSDSSRDDGNNKHGGGSSSSSPLSSQQTVDFSDLPPLPLVHSSGVGGALNAEIGELPVDILDRASDGQRPSRPADLRPQAPSPLTTATTVNMMWTWKTLKRAAHCCDWMVIKDQ